MECGVGIDGGASTIKVVLVHGDPNVEVVAAVPVGSRPLETTRNALCALRERLPDNHVRIGVTGTAGRTLCEVLGIEPVDESTALATALGTLHPDVRSVVEMGMESQRFLTLAPDEVSGRLRIEESALGHKCAAGSGSFLEHMRKRLNYASIEEFAAIAEETEPPATLSGRCGVFTESDIVHLYQKGTPRERIAAGIHQAICRNYRCAMMKGRGAVPRVAFVGGVSLNPAVAKYLRLELGLADGTLLVPEHARVMGAIGAALRASVEVDLDAAIRLLGERLALPISYPTAPRLSLERTEILAASEEFPLGLDVPLAALGVDIGSVSTKAALVTRVDGKFQVLASYYRRTNGDPLAAVRDTLGTIRRQVAERGYQIGRIVAATTGSGRYLTGDYLGAELVKNEITAQANGALAFIPDVESVFEIGGQDSKYIALKDGVITDFEMNKACAAGTGAFLEKQAANLGVPLEEFGDRALAGESPPELDWQCTVFSESAVHHYRQNNVPVEDLCAGICLASVRNYLNKNVGSRPVGGVVAFQGAVAFNRGMVAAYETMLGRRIVVPPYPHLTGAIGAAKIAYEEAPADATFRGFDAVLDARYTIASFECKGCANRCDVNTFEIEGGDKFFYNDRCEKFSGRQKRRAHHAGASTAGASPGAVAASSSPESAGDLPDLFAEREKLLDSVYSRPAPEGAPRVGIPRIGTFNDHYPFYKAFFTELGFEVVPSDLTNTQIIRDGVSTVAAEPCFPIKVAHGHVVDVQRKGVDFIFLPAVMRAEWLEQDFCESQSCPYVQALPELLRAALRLEGDKYDGKVLTPRLFLNRGRRHLRRELGKMIRQLASRGSMGQRVNGSMAGADSDGGNSDTTDRSTTHRASDARPHHSPLTARPTRGLTTHRASDARPHHSPLTTHLLDRALDVALEALAEFRRRLAARGEEVLSALPKDSLAFVVLGRPYTLHDAAINMHVGKKIQDLGILAIPQDMLPLPTAGAAETWRLVYARQIQNRLAAARIIRQDPRLRAVVLTYFGCGPDSFANQFLHDELNEPAYVMQIDEHTADAGVITRIEAFADTVRAAREPQPFVPFDLESRHPSDLDGKTLWVPDLSAAAHVVVSTLVAHGVNARLLPRSPDPALNLARAAIPEDVCVPALYTTEDILYRTRQPDFEPEREAFFQGNASGPCRYGMYALLQRRILDRQGFQATDIATLGARNLGASLSMTFSLVLWDALVSHDLLEKMLLHTRPYEVEPGGSDAIFARALEEVCAAIKPHREHVESRRGKWDIARGHHVARFQDILRRAQAGFVALPRREEERPMVGLIGEFYVRLHDRSNQDIVRKLERGGAEVWLAPASEFFGYANRIRHELSAHEFGDTRSRKALRQWAIAGFQDWLAVHNEHHLWQAALPYLEGFEELTPAELVNRGEEFVHRTFGGEAICSMGKAVDFMHHGVDGIVSAIPFNCMPGITVQALSHALRRKHGNVPFLTLDFDGFVDSGRDSRLAGFLAQVKERREARDGKKQPRPAAAPASGR